MFGGDMVEGITVFPGQAFEVQSHLFDQLFGVVALQEQFVRRMLAIFPKVVVWEEYGNHGRIGRRGDVPGSDNIDRISYRIAKERFANEPRVTWHSSTSWHQMVEIGNYRAMLAHGDEIKSFGGNTLRLASCGRRPPGRPGWSPPSKTCTWGTSTRRWR